MRARTAGRRLHPLQDLGARLPRCLHRCKVLGRLRAHGSLRRGRLPPGYLTVHGRPAGDAMGPPAGAGKAGPDGECERDTAEAAIEDGSRGGFVTRLSIGIAIFHHASARRGHATGPCHPATFSFIIQPQRRGGSHSGISKRLAPAPPAELVQGGRGSKPREVAGDRTARAKGWGVAHNLCIDTGRWRGRQW